MQAAHSPSGQAISIAGAISAIHSDRNAVVTPAFANITGVTYQISTISMMYIKEVRRTNWLGTAVVAALLLGAAIAAGAWMLGGRQELRWVCYVLAGSCLAAPWLLRMRAEHSLIIATAAGERIAFTSTDRAYVGLLRSRVEQAMTARAGLDSSKAPPDPVIAAPRMEPNPDVQTAAFQVVQA